jgi:formate dehydrogenase beta subunit
MSKQAQLPKVNIGDRQHPGAGRRKGRVRPRGRGAVQEALDEIRNLIGERPIGAKPHEHRHLIDYLHIIQDEFGCLSHRHMAALAREMELSQAEVHEVASFYSQFIIVPDGEKSAPVTVRVCDSLACSMQGAEELLQQCKQHFGDDVSVVHSPCMGRCDCAPVVSANKRHIDHASVDEIDKVIEAGDLEPVIPDYKDFDDYIAEGGYSLLQACLNGEYERQQIIDMLSDSSLRGLGGAGYPTGRKWATVLKLPKPKIVAVNFDESEMGTYKDRFFVEQDPHRLLEGILLAAWTCETYKGYIYLRDEYHYIREVLEQEIHKLDSAGLTKHCRLFMSRGAGAYICGERSAMLESIEGKRGYPRLKDPRTTIVGLFGIPTLINNAETLFWVRDIIEKGPEWFSSQGRNERPCPRAFSVSGRVKNPGVKLTSAGITMKQLLEEHCGGMEEGHTFKGYCLGGSAGGILPASMADIPLDFDTMEEYGCQIGSAAITVFSDKDSIQDIVKNLMLFFEDESCGQCTPCRVGTEKAVKLVQQDIWDETLLNDLCDVMEFGSICGLGQAAPAPIRTALKYFRDELGL